MRSSPTGFREVYREIPAAVEGGRTAVSDPLGAAQPLKKAPAFRDAAGAVAQQLFVEGQHLLALLDELRFRRAAWARWVRIEHAPPLMPECEGCVDVGAGV